MRRAKGFSLIELLIVVAIILVIAAIAVPSFLRSRMAANESTAVGNIRTLNTAQVAYAMAYPTVGYANSVSVLGGDCSSTLPSSTGACLIDSVLASGQKSGYSYAIPLASVTGTPATTYNVITAPLTPNYSGVRYFCSFEDGVLRDSYSSIATCDATVTALP